MPAVDFLDELVADLTDATEQDQRPADYPCEGPNSCPREALYELLVIGGDPETGSVVEVMRPLCRTHFRMASTYLNLFHVEHLARLV